MTVNGIKVAQTYSISTSSNWQSFWSQIEKGINLSRRKICFERANFIMSHPAIQKISSPVIYDLGCGYAEVSKHLLLEIDDSKLVAVDWSSDALLVAKSRLTSLIHRVELIKGDCCNDQCFFDDHHEKADIVLSLGVIEHFHDSEEILKNSIKVLKPSGILVLMVPNIYSSAFISRKLKEINGTWQFGFQREYSTKTLRKWCTNAGLEVISEHVLQRCHSPADDVLLKILSNIDRKISTFIPKWGFYSYIFAQKRI